MKLNSKELQDKAAWEKAGISLPRFDSAALQKAAKESPRWVHFGAGNIFRAFPAALQQTLLEKGLEKAGIIVAEGYDGEIIDKLFTPHDNLSLVVTLKADGGIDKKVIGSIASAHRIDKDEEMDNLRAVFRAPSLQMVSFTITEKGYSLSSPKGTLPDVEVDFKAGPAKPASYIGRLTALCYERYKAGALPLALVSMDNCSHNGDKLYAAVENFARVWAEAGLVEKGFLDYIRDPKKVSFPWSMIDKITPRPDESVKLMLEKIGFTDTEGQITSKNTYIAPFVNAEEAQYLVIEDLFPNGRPALEEAGVLFAAREIVDKVEKMKVCTCLNPLHTALAVFGCLLGYTKISDEMKDPDLLKLVEIIGYKEGLPVVVDPGIISPRQFIDEVLKVRIPNPFMPDTPQRIATDTSQKIPIRFGETIKAYMASQSLNIKDLKLIPLVLAAWIRYLLSIDDEGKHFEVSPDPMLPILQESLKGIELGKPETAKGKLRAILSNEKIFAVNLYDAGLAEKVEGYFDEMLAGKGAVRKTLQKYLK
ncbi:MAG: mannitol dehydrogenase family protein [Spirochaetaceae bacterium]|jgi:fructuronate reductase|nr:mannitol dehydrogenase family protein [Spirochaetaceae bacterium]